MFKSLNEIKKYVLREKASQADIILWLQGDRLDRAKEVIKLYKNQIAPKIVISGNNILVGPNKRKNENDLNLQNLKNELLKNNVSENDIIIEDQSLNTAQQAENTIKLAIKNNWKKIALVTSPYHQARAFLTFIKKILNTNKNIQIINNTASDLDLNNIPSGRTQKASELIKLEDEKIYQYSKDVASISELNNYIIKLHENNYTFRQSK